MNIRLGLIFNKELFHENSPDISKDFFFTFISVLNIWNIVFNMRGKKVFHDFNKNKILTDRNIWGNLYHFMTCYRCNHKIQSEVPFGTEKKKDEYVQFV